MSTHKEAKPVNEGGKQTTEHNRYSRDQFIPHSVGPLNHLPSSAFTFTHTVTVLFYSILVLIQTDTITDTNTHTRIYTQRAQRALRGWGGISFLIQDNMRNARAAEETLLSRAASFSFPVD